MLLDFIPSVIKFIAHPGINDRIGSDTKFTKKAECASYPEAKQFAIPCQRLSVRVLVTVGELG